MKEKTKIIVGYSTNRDQQFIKTFNKHIKDTIGLSLKKDQYDILAVINTEGKSLTAVYNSILNLAKNNNENYILLMIHHDIHFKSKNWGKTLLNLFNNNDIDIIGQAGTDVIHENGTWWLGPDQKFNNKDLWGKVWHTDGKKEWKTDFTTPLKKCAKLQPVVAVDGVYIAFNPDTCLPFDSSISGFHFYDISFCLDNYLAGKKIAVTETLPIVHESGGQLSQAWENNRKLICARYSLPIKIDLN